MRKRKRNTVCKTIKDDAKEIQSDRGNRRDTRLGTIVGIVAILVTFCTLLFRCTKAVMSVWPESGYIYYVLMWSVFIIPLSATLIIGIDIISYVVIDLNRYNIQNEQYERFDKESDQKYAFMIKDFKIMLGVFLVELVVVALINSYLQNSKQGVFCIIVLGLCIIVGILFIVKQIHKKKINWGEVWTVFKRIVALMTMVLIVLVIAMSFITNKEAEVDITFEKSGDITIEDAIDEDFGTASLGIYTNEDLLIDKNDISIDDVLRAKESGRQSIQNDSGKEIGNAQKIPSEMLYWKYQYRISDLNLVDGKYYVVIEILHKNKSVQIVNMFEVEREDFTFCKNSIYKAY